MNQSYLDDIGRRISSAAEQFTPPRRPSTEQKADAAALLRDLVQATRPHDVDFGDLDAVADFPRMALQLVMHRDERR